MKYDELKDEGSLLDRNQQKNGRSMATKDMQAVCVCGSSMGGEEKTDVHSKKCTLKKEGKTDVY